MRWMAETGSRLWRYEIDGWVNSVDSSPVVANDVVYVGSADGHLYALDAGTGNRLWRYETGSGVESSPTVANGVVYVGSKDSYLYAIRRRHA